jgi:hypothetical protein
MSEREGLGKQFLEKVPFSVMRSEWHLACQEHIPLHLTQPESKCSMMITSVSLSQIVGIRLFGEECNAGNLAPKIKCGGDMLFSSPLSEH